MTRRTQLPLGKGMLRPTASAAAGDGGDDDGDGDGDAGVATTEPEVAPPLHPGRLSYDPGSVG